MPQHVPHKTMKGKYTTTVNSGAQALKATVTVYAINFIPTDTDTSSFVLICNTSVKYR